MFKLLGILSSRWLQAAVILLWLAALQFRQRWLLFTAIGLAVFVILAIAAKLLHRTFRKPGTREEDAGATRYGGYDAGRDEKERSDEERKK